MSNRISYFDQMKGVAIILVVVGHIMQFSFGYNQSDVVRMLGIFHMPIFFYISGYFHRIKPGTSNWTPYQAAEESFFTTYSSLV